mmetsp:Transcript_48430/g.96323  ORF Transcript_48430/g.96323 Transcript_48430/m.96323 type:complete len:87 (-) Transcript_48430:62-322(-)
MKKFHMRHCLFTPLYTKVYSEDTTCVFSPLSGTRIGSALVSCDLPTQVQFMLGPSGGNGGQWDERAAQQAARGSWFSFGSGVDVNG